MRSKFLMMLASLALCWGGPAVFAADSGPPLISPELNTEPTPSVWPAHNGNNSESSAVGSSIGPANMGTSHYASYPSTESMAPSGGSSVTTTSSKGTTGTTGGSGSGHN